MMWEKTLDAGGKKTLLRWGKSALDVYFVWTSVGSWGKILERVAHAMPSVRYKKNRIITLLNDSTSGDVRWRPQALISTNRWNKLRDRILIEICESGRWTEFAKTSLCIILVALIYLESAKIYTGTKIVRGLKRLRTTAIRCSLVYSNMQNTAVQAQYSEKNSRNAMSMRLSLLNATSWRVAKGYA